MKIIYKSDDGREFETEQDCREYENNTAKIIKTCIEEVDAYDGNGNRIYFSLIDNADELEEAFEQIWYIKFKTQNAIDVFDYLIGEFEVPNLREDIALVGVGKRYFFDSSVNLWKSVEDEQYRINQRAIVFID